MEWKRNEDETHLNDVRRWKGDEDEEVAERLPPSQLSWRYFSLINWERLSNSHRSTYFYL